MMQREGAADRRRRKECTELLVARWRTLAEAYEILSRLQGAAGGRERHPRSGRRARAARGRPRT